MRFYLYSTLFFYVGWWNLCLLIQRKYCEAVDYAVERKDEDYNEHYAKVEKRSSILQKVPRVSNFFRL